ncbi:multi-sensor hybrid histidine kinase [Geobacter metallireducens RCH3]|uniref:histidine kinase n=1 Tax=Geobacter metallireducens (strain ATCC 53774 / DSM 7210 / GS-15) TaxID=269799 RepID=Q39UC7_GEOMG|nr:hybrid sensor histidine kinase/response regulator [Geobacter metallireducens]ABB32147.1 response receiver sensor histidine kinase response regulator, PAS domain-containing [Geobacter metallireducens GS-15]EHP88663.1 multi-sensor hybrid histidine kinase [Geobacter metallireducens RCH3]
MTVAVNPSSLRVLIIDDSPFDTELVIRELNSCFITHFRRVDTAEEMLDALASATWDIVISDYVMPSFSGLNAIALLRKEGYTTPLIVVSGKIEDEAAVETMRAGANDYILKDNLARLVPAIRRELEESEVRRQKKKVEDELRKLSHAVEQSPVSIIITDQNGTIEYVNPKFTQVTGYGVDEAVGQTPRILKSGKMPDSEYRRLWETITSGREWHGDIINKKKNGDLFWERASISAIKDAEGVITHFVGVKEDISEQRRTELAHKQAMNQLRQAQKMEAIGQLAGGIAHDFNNLLTVINGYSTMLLHEMPVDDPFRSEVNEILKAGERAADLTHQLLAFSRRQMLEPKVININHLVRNMEKMLKRLIRENIVMHASLYEQLGVVKVDPGQVEQIIMNLLVNARDALGNGGIITIETADVYLDKTFVNENPGAVEGNYVMLAVHDNGEGMTEETRRKIFEPFFTTKGQGKGTGLGLATVYGIVKQSGGYIQVASELGQWTSFRVYFPRVDSEAWQEETVTSHEGPKGNETILVIEDEIGVLNLTAHTLKRNGYEVLQASSPSEASRIFSTNHHRIDLVLSDVIMPEKNGPALVREFREKLPDLKILFMSGYTDDTISSPQIIDEHAAFINKPFTPDVLVERVRDVLEGRLNM